MRLPTSTTAASVSSSVSSARTISNTFMVCTGLKKRTPTHCLARKVTLADLRHAERGRIRGENRGRAELLEHGEDFELRFQFVGNGFDDGSAWRAASCDRTAYSSREEAASAAAVSTLPSLTAWSRSARISVSALRSAFKGLREWCDSRRTGSVRDAPAHDSCADHSNDPFPPTTCPPARGP